MTTCLCFSAAVIFPHRQSQAVHVCNKFRNMLEVKKTVMGTSNINVKEHFVIQVFHTVEYPGTCMVFGFGHVLLLMDEKRHKLLV